MNDSLDNMIAAIRRETKEPKMPDPLDRENPVMPEPEIDPALPIEAESIIHILLNLPLGVHVGVDKGYNEVVIRVPRDVLERRLRATVFA